MTASVLRTLSPGQPSSSTSRARTVQCTCSAAVNRRGLIAQTCGLVLLGSSAAVPSTSQAEEYVAMGALEGKDYGKTPMLYPDYTMTSSGLQYKDMKEGTGPSPQLGQVAVIDWQGYTVGYYGRVFEARNKPKGSSFEGNDKIFLRLTLGKDKIIPGVQEALMGMKTGGIRRIIIPDYLGYPGGDYNSWAPSPTTFAGKRTLDFVLGNKGLIDKTLLIDIELMKLI